MMNKFSSTTLNKFLLIIFALLLISIILVLHPIIRKNIYTFRLNYLDTDLSQTYTNNRLGFSFNYSRRANIYKWFDDEDHGLRIFPDGNNQGWPCDIYINKNQAVGTSNKKVINYHNISWIQTDYINTYSIPFLGVGTAYDTTWFTKARGNEIVIYAPKEMTMYCKRIVSSFMLTN